jgi:hypothetical protein
MMPVENPGAIEIKGSDDVKSSYRSEEGREL